jgi:hypothetical protein
MGSTGDMHSELLLITRKTAKLLFGEKGQYFHSVIKLNITLSRELSYGIQLGTSSGN